jgi:1,4-dihydroxy-2-naphthoate octaprenyltransferase
VKEMKYLGNANNWPLWKNVVFVAIWLLMAIVFFRQHRLWWVAFSVASLMGHSAMAFQTSRKKHRATATLPSS